jgi:hypothetical protein
VQPMPRPLFTPSLLLFSLLGCASLVACSSDNGSADGTAGNSGQGGDSGAAGASAGSGNGGTAGVAPVVGFFNLTMVEETATTVGYAAFSGKVFDGEVPAATVWTVLAEDGDCQLLKPTIPYCDGGCGTGVCVADGQCQSQPTAHSVGDVTLNGVSTVAGDSSIVISPIIKGYSTPAGVAFSYPPVAEGATVTLSAAGGDYDAFSIEAVGIAPLVLANSEYPLSANAPLSLTWTPPSDSSQSRIAVHLDISHHGGSKGKIVCDTSDDGAVEIGAGLTSQLLGLGVAGFPTIIVTRRTGGQVMIAPGLVSFGVQQSIERAVLVEGVTSCTGDADCTSPQTCASDLTCQ